MDPSSNFQDLHLFAEIRASSCTDFPDYKAGIDRGKYFPRYRNLDPIRFNVLRDDSARQFWCCVIFCERELVLGLKSQSSKRRVLGMSDNINRPKGKDLPWVSDGV